MIGKLLKSDFLKIRRKGMYFLSFLGAFGVVALQMVNYGVRYEWLLQQSENDWMYYLRNVSNFTPFAIILGIAILTSFMASIENETNSWKQLLALPVSKMSVYLSKFTVLAVLLFISSILLWIFTLLFGLFLDLGDDIPMIALLEQSFYPLFASLPILALQLWIATVSKNQGFPITLGIIGVILSFSAYNLPDWLIWKWPTLMNEFGDPLMNVWLGIGFGLLLYLVGMFDFIRRDAK